MSDNESNKVLNSSVSDDATLEDNIESAERSIDQIRELMKNAASADTADVYRLILASNPSAGKYHPLGKIEYEPDLDLGYECSYDDDYQPAEGIHQKLVAVANSRYVNSSASPYKYKYDPNIKYESDTYVESDSSDDEIPIASKVATRLGELEVSLDDINSSTIRLETALDKVSSVCELNQEAIYNLNSSSNDTNERLIKLEKGMNLIKGRLDTIIALLRYDSEQGTN